MGQLVEVPGTEKHYPADLVLLAMGFGQPGRRGDASLWRRARRLGNAPAPRPAGGYATNVAQVFMQTCAGPKPGGVGHPRRATGRLSGDEF